MATSGSTEQDRRDIHPDDLSRYVEEELKAYNNGEGIDITYRVITPTGRVRHLREISEAIEDESGQVYDCPG
jgi:hypothetical protein